MGTYPTTPSLVLATGEDLQKHINSNKEKLIGKAILDKFGADLPYLPKVNYPEPLASQNTQKNLRFSQSPKPSLSKSTQTKASLPNSTRKTPKSSETPTTSPKSQSLSENSKSSLAGNHFPRSSSSSRPSPLSNHDSPKVLRHTSMERR
jgi:hypothetical protein